ncbi:MAG: DoxX family protein, partial [Acidimicrobiales bacterium]
MGQERAMATRRPAHSQRRALGMPAEAPQGAGSGAGAPGATVGARTDTSWGWLGPPPRALYSSGWVLLPLRAFLGFTFCFAGLQKLANPAFFNAANPASIQSQFAAAARRSPIRALVSPLVHEALLVGVIIAIGELAVGIGALTGLWTRVAAGGGALISLMLFLTVSYHSSPYYTGSDIVFFFAWWPLVLAGSGGVLSLEALLANRVRRDMGAELAAVVPVPFAAIRRVCGVYDEGCCRARRGRPCEPAPCPYLAQRPRRASRLAADEMDRRAFTGRAVAATAGVGFVVAGAAAVLGRLAGGAPGKFGVSSLPDSPRSTSGPASTVPSTSPTTTPGREATSSSQAPTTTAPRQP